MKVIATINHNIDKDTAEYIVKEFGHRPILEDKPSIETNYSKYHFDCGYFICRRGVILFILSQKSL